MNFAQIKVPENLKSERDTCTEIKVPVKSTCSELKGSDDSAGNSTSNKFVSQGDEKKNVVAEDCFSQDSGVGSSQELLLSSQESVLPGEDVSSPRNVLPKSSQDVLSDVPQANKELKVCYPDTDNGSINSDVKPLLKSQIKFTNAITSTMSKKRRYSEGDFIMGKTVEIDLHDEISFSSLKRKLANCSSSESVINDEKHNKVGKKDRDYSDDDVMMVKKKQKMSKPHEFTSSGESRTDVSENKQKCIICVSALRDSAFMHGQDGHMSCCYRCAMNTWKEHKRCPICNRKVRNVVKIYQA